MKDASFLVKKIKAYSDNPELVKEPTTSEMADLVLLVLSAVTSIEKIVKEGRLDGYTPKPDKDYLSLESAKKEINSYVREMLNKTDKALSQTSIDIEKRIVEAIANLRNGNDGIVTDAEIERAASIAFSMLDLPDFDKLVTEHLTSNSDAIRDALELLQGDNRYSVEIPDVKGLEEALNQLAQLRTANGGTIGKQQVYGFIRQAIADGIITGGSGGGHTIEDEGTPLTQRTKLNFVGAGVTVTDDAGDDATVVTISGGGSATPAGSDTQVQFNDGGSFGGDAGLTYDKTTDTLTAVEVVVEDALRVRQALQMEETSGLGDLITIEAPASLTDSYSLVLPPDAGSNNQVLKTDGSGNLSWGNGFTELPATGTVNGSNLIFTFTQVPSYIVADGVWFKPTLKNGTVAWTNVSTTITMVNPPQFDIWGVA